MKKLLLKSSAIVGLVALSAIGASACDAPLNEKASLSLHSNHEDYTLAPGSQFTHVLGDLAKTIEPAGELTAKAAGYDRLQMIAFQFACGKVEKAAWGEVVINPAQIGAFELTLDGDAIGSAGDYLVAKAVGYDLMKIGAGDGAMSTNPGATATYERADIRQETLDGKISNPFLLTNLEHAGALQTGILEAGTTKPTSWEEFIQLTDIRRETLDAMANSPLLFEQAGWKTGALHADYSGSGYMAGISGL